MIIMQVTNQLVQWPLKYSILISPSDEVEDSQIFLMDNVINRTILEVNLILPSKRLWDITLLAYGCPEYLVTDAIKLSKI